MGNPEDLEKAESPFKLIGRPFVSTCTFELLDTAPSSTLKTDLDVVSKYSLTTKNIEIFILLNVRAISDTGSEVYKIGIDVNSTFHFTGADNEAEMVNFSKLNGPAIVYPFLRASLFNLCFASGIQPVTLPVINFHKFPVKVESVS